ncbi:hypothetical protein Tco_0546570 [Tanacetum coccineum]
MNVIDKAMQSFLDMVPFYKNELGFTMEQKTSSSFKTTSLLQPWKTFTKIIISHCMTNFPKISRRARDRRSTRLTPPAPVPPIDKADEMILQDTLQKLKRWWKDERMLLMIVQSLGMMIKIFPALEEEEITNEVYELKRREKGKIVEESRSTPSPTPIRSPRIHTDLVSSDIEKLQELTEVMVESLPTMVDKHIKEQVEKQVPEQVKVQVPVYVAKGLLLERQQNKEETDKMIAKAMLQERGRLQAKISSQIQQAIDNNMPSLVDSSMKFETLQAPQTTCRTSAVCPRDQDDPHDDAPPIAENSAKRHKTSEYETHVTRESSEQYASDDDEIPTKQVSQDIMEEVSLTINEAEQKKIADEMLRQRCTSGDEHQYHIDQMKNFLKNPEAPALSLINQDLLYLKKGNSESEKIVLSLHKFPNPHAKIFYIKSQKEPGKPKEVVYSNSKIIQVIKTYWELGHEHKFITDIVLRRANECIVSITEPDYKNLNKNDIEDIYLLIMNGKVPDYAKTDLTEDEVEYLKLFEEEIEVGLKYRNQMRRWEMYVNGRPLGPRKERLE